MIPRILHHFWIGEKEPPSCMKELAEKQQANGWVYILWNESKIDDFRLQNAERYHLCPTLPGKTNIVRVEVLNRYGGVYVDADSEMLKPLDDALLHHHFFAAYEHEALRPDLVATGIMGSVPNSLVTQRYIAAIASVPLAEIERGQPWITVGSKQLTSVLNTMTGGYFLYPSYFFYPVHYTGASCTSAQRSSAYTNQLWVSTKNPGLYKHKKPQYITPVDATALEVNRFRVATAWYFHQHAKRNSITFMVRARNEEGTIERCLQSIIDYCSGLLSFEIVLILNQCTDETQTVAEHVFSNTKEKQYEYKILQYPYQLAKPGVETFVTAPNSIHSMVFFSQWCMMQCKNSWVFRWDADFLMTEPLANSLAVTIGNERTGSIVLTAIDNDNVHNTETYVFRKELKPIYFKLRFWEVQKYLANSTNLSPSSISVPLSHCSSLKRCKGYYALPPWWLGTEYADKYQKRYDELRAMLPPNAVTYCRASDPACQEMLIKLPMLIEHLDVESALQDWI